MLRPLRGLRRRLPATPALPTLAACRSRVDEPVDGAGGDGWGIDEELAVTARCEAATPRAGCHCVLDRKGQATPLCAP